MSDHDEGGVEAIIDLTAYRKNLARAVSVVAPATVMAVVKADAYGHGLLPMASAAFDAGIRWFGALDIPTALALRHGVEHSVEHRVGGIHGGISREAAIFAWLFDPDENFVPAIAAGIDLGLSTVAQLDRVADAAARSPARVHLKIDTGLHRNGASAADWPQLVARAVELETRGRVELVGVWTHIAEASDAEDTAAIARFHEAIAIAQRLGAAFSLRHLAASAASFARADSRFDLVRVGAFGYGIAPGGGIRPIDLGLIPSMTLTAPVVEAGDQLVVVGAGLLHGIPSTAAGAVSVAIGGRLFPVTAVNGATMTVAGSARPGDRAVLFGSGIQGEQTLQEWADAMGTIGEEIVTRLTDRVVRRFSGLR